MNYFFNQESISTNKTENLDEMDVPQIVTYLINWFKTTGLKLIIGLIILFIIFKLINLLANRIRKQMRAKKRDETITNVVYNILRKALKVVIFIIFLGYIGIDTAGIGSIIASFAVGIGLALQGSLSNIAGWFIIIFMRPFKLGDYIACQSVEGTVEDIKLFYTYLVSYDNKVLMIPNGALANGNITNFSTKENRRVDLEFQISYGDDVNKAIKVIEDVLKSNALILTTPTPFVKMSKCDSSSINIVCKPWTKKENYWDVYFKVIKDVKDAFDKNDITVPYNQLDIHINNN